MRFFVVLPLILLQLGEILFALTATQCLSRCGLAKTSTQRIVQGEEVERRFAVFVQISRTFLCPYGTAGQIVHEKIEKGCTGSILSSDAILTAGHCFRIRQPCRRLNDDDVYVMADAQDVTVYVKFGKSGQMALAGRKRFVHPDYNPITNENDIALIRLKTQITFTADVGPICLAKGGQISGETKLNVYGYGYHTEENENGESKRVYDKKLRHELEDYKQLSECRDLGGKFTDGIHLCAIGKTGGIDNGDSGGPLVRYENKVALQVGISCSTIEINKGDAGKTISQLDKYTAIEKFCPWIKEKVGVDCMDVASDINGWADDSCKPYLVAPSRFRRNVGVISEIQNANATILAGRVDKRARRSKMPMKIRGKVLCNYWDEQPEEQPWPNAQIELWDEDSNIFGDVDDFLGSTSTDFDGSFVLTARNDEKEWDGIEPYLLIRHRCLQNADGLKSNCTYLTRRLLEPEEAAGTKSTIIQIGRIYPAYAKLAKYKYSTDMKCEETK